MPVHDWTRVSAGRFHHFHCLWIVELSNALNGGLLPPDYYAMAEQVADEAIPDVLTLEAVPSNGGQPSGDPFRGATTVALAPPRVRLRASVEVESVVPRPRSVVIRSADDDRIVAFLEVLSPGNKSSGHALRSFVAKALDAMERGRHLLLIDLHPPTSRDPQGIHAAIWETQSDEPYHAPNDKPLTLVAYASGKRRTAYIEPIAVGDPLPAMPLFLDADHYVDVPLEETYQAAWNGVPQRWRGLLSPL